jgi:phage protein D/phage baseplate assembly protein gpV
MTIDRLFPAGLRSDLGADVYAPTFELHADGVRLPAAVMARCVSIAVSQRAGVPSSFTLRLHDPGLHLTGATGPLRRGTKVQVHLGYVGDARPVVIGRVRAVAAEFPASGPPVVTLDGYDALHDLTQQRRHVVYAGEGGDRGIRDSDVVDRIARAHELRSNSPATEPRRSPRVQTHEATDFEFLQMLARANERDLFVDGEGVLRFTPFEDRNPGPVRLTWGRNLVSFSVRRTEVGQVDGVEVRAWSPSEKTVVVGSAPRSVVVAGEGRVLVVGSSEAATTEEADRLASSLYARRVQSRLTGGGSVTGTIDLQVGRRLQISGIGDEFSGPYVTTAVSHRLGADGFTTDFDVVSAPEEEPGRAQALGVAGDPPGAVAAGRRSAGDSAGKTLAGVVPGVVVEADDPNRLARVKVRLPVLGDDVGVWARLSAPLAGAGRGVLLVPRPDDEVLVAFEHGDPSRAYVVGSLWSETDPPPDIDDAPAVDVWAMRTEAGNLVQLTDAEGKRGLAVVDAEGNGLLVDTGSGTVTLKAGTEVVLETPDAAVTVSSADVTVKASGTVTVESLGDTTVTASGTLTQKGAVVRIN